MRQAPLKCVQSSVEKSILTAVAGVPEVIGDGEFVGADAISGLGKEDVTLHADKFEIAAVRTNIPISIKLMRAVCRPFSRPGSVEANLKSV